MDEIREFLMVQMPDVVNGLEAGEIAEMTRWGLTKALGYGLSRTADICMFIALMFDVAPNFHLHPPIHRVLSDLERSPERRLHNAIATTTEADWEAAQADYDWTAWFPPFEQLEVLDNAGAPEPSQGEL